jgi:hypothetical protein
LLLTHAQIQTLNQQRLESYLAASNQPNLDINDRFDPNSPSYQKRGSGHGAGTNTPRDLNSRIKVLELYILHVLPRNDEWEYAREFVGYNEVLDDEKKDLFLQALDALQDEKNATAQIEADIQREQEAQLEREKAEAQARRADEESAARQENERPRPQVSTSHKSSHSETDYGIESSPSANGSKQRPLRNSSTRLSRSSIRPPPPSSKAVAPPSFYTQASNVVTNLRTILYAASQSTAKNPMALLRILFILITFLLVFGQKAVRERVKKLLRGGWGRVKSTVGMGVKVSYI